jgi:hypothetical protein
MRMDDLVSVRRAVHTSEGFASRKRIRGLYGVDTEDIGYSFD